MGNIVREKHQRVVNRVTKQLAKKGPFNWHEEGIDLVVKNNEIIFRELDTEDWYRVKVTRIRRPII